uniref:Rad4 beta-hairpin domain-containing protein n=1 Tax=Strigamia maritima TaxID=126957 RepID=T1JE06_STRMM
MKRACVRKTKPKANEKRPTRSKCAVAPTKEKTASNLRTRSKLKTSKTLSKTETAESSRQNGQKLPTTLSDDDADTEIVRQSGKDNELGLKLHPTDGYDEEDETVPNKQASTSQMASYKQPSSSQMSPYFSKSVAENNVQTLHFDDSSDDEWEEVENGEEVKKKEEKEVVIPKEGVEITINAVDFVKRKKKKEFDWNNYARLCINRFKKDLQQDMHKVHVMCLLSHGLYINNEINNDEIKALTMSIIPERTVNRNLDCSAILVSALRLLGFDARLIFSMQPISVKVIDLIKPKPTGKADDESKKSIGKQKATTKRDEITEEEEDGTKKTRQSFGKRTSAAKKDEKAEEEEDNTTKTRQSFGHKKDKETEDISIKTRRSVGKRTTTAKEDKKTEDEVDNTKKPRKSLGKQSSTAKKDEEAKDNTKITRKSVGKRRCTINKDEIYDIDVEDDNVDDSDYESESSSRKRKVVGRKRLRTADGDAQSGARKKAKSDEENETGNDYWAEVYLEKKSQWICIDCVNGRVDCESEMEIRSKKPFIYVVSFDNRNKIKDLTSRYAKNWLTLNRKFRFDPDWWAELLEPFRPRLTIREKKESAAMEEELLKKPMPTTIGEFKGHPLYALTRHFLKFEALYPPESAPVGFIRKEPIYSRDCVHTLHSRETWLKEAKSIILGEKPYKIVKARPKWNKSMGQLESNLPLEVFGEWQTKDYEPPIATNGKVPRNEYGNVDMFKECMLPVGTVHLRVPRLLKVANKLGIDCAAAMTGWDFLKSGNRPIYDGWIVCEEFKDVLMEAWRHQMKLDFDRQGEKREKRVYGNWRRLIRAVLIREKLNTKYFKLRDK